MDIVLLCSRLALAAVFGAAALGKLADRRGSRGALVGFGVPERLAAPGAVLLPAVELAVVAALLPSGSAAWGGAAALVLLAVFAAAIALALARGRRPDCHCFGRLHSEPAGPRALVRNGVLAAPAALVAIGGRGGAGPSADAWIARLDATGVALVVTAAAAAALAAGGAVVATALLRRHGVLLLRIDRLEDALTRAGIELDDAEKPAFAEGLPLDAPAPAFALETTAGVPLSLAGLLERGRPVLLAFVSAGCGPCHALLPELAAWETSFADELTVVTLGSGDAETLRAQAEEHGLRHLAVDPDGAVQAAYRSAGTPGAVLVSPDGAIASRVAVGGAGVASLVGTATARESEPGLPVGSPVPDLRRPLLDGETVTLASLIERETLLVFWNPGCGYCSAMRDDLLRLEAGGGDGTPAIVVVSSGDEEDARADGFRSPVLLDPSFEVAGAFGAGGTPMAVLVAADGTVASRLAAGADDVLDLAGAAPARLLGGAR